MGNFTEINASVDIAVDLVALESQWEIATVASVASADYIAANASQTERYQQDSWGSVMAGYDKEVTGNATISSAYISEGNNKLLISVLLNPVTLEYTPPEEEVVGVPEKNLTIWGCSATGISF